MADTKRKVGINSEEFKASLSQSEPPDSLSAPMLAL